MKVISQENIELWLAELLRRAVVVAPVVDKSVIIYQEIDDVSRVAWDYTRPDMPPRNWVIPMTEPILFIEQGKKTVLREPGPPKETILFGLRPCDAKSFKVLDALFLDQDPVDPQYKKHREAVSLIGISCPSMWDSCFCTVVGSTPNDGDGLDILLTKVDDGYVVEALTKKGESLISGLPLEEHDVVVSEPLIPEGLPTLIPSSEWAELFKDLFWEQLSSSCMSCRVCSFVCPTCRCYDVRDEVVGIHPGVKEYERLRAWDTCASEGFRRIAGGHNPRNTQLKRLKNRFFCKFMYYPEDFNILGCVGCGRCIDACPAGIDILEVVAKVDDLVALQQ